MNRVTRRYKAYADLIASDQAKGARWISQAQVGDSKKLGPNVHSILAVRGYDVLNLDEYMETFNDVSAAPERLIRRVVQSVATNALKTLFPLDMLVNQVVLSHSHTSSHQQKVERPSWSTTQTSGSLSLPQ